MEGRKEGSERQAFRFRVSIEGSPKDAPEMSAYMFDGQGELIAQAPVDKSGAAELRATAEELAHARLLIGPSPTPSGEKSNLKVTASSLERMGAYEPSWRRRAAQREYELLPIPIELIERWRRCVCRVHGRVVKPVTIGGVTVERPVCRARVHICEVDRLPLIIARFPDDIIRRIRDELRYIIERPWPPIPEPGPGPDPYFELDTKIRDFTPAALAEMNRRPVTSLVQQAKTVAPRQLMQRAEAAHDHGAGHADCGCGGKAAAALKNAAPIRIAPTPSLIRRDEPARERAPISDTLRQAVTTASVEALRRTLVSEYLQLRPIFCRWPWLWPYWYDCDEVAVIETDDLGRFDARVRYPCHGDRPDLYFWVEYPLGGVWTTVYRPGMPCGTYWDFQCGSEVTIRVTDPRVPACGGDDPLPGKQVAVILVGNNQSLHDIGDSASMRHGLTAGGAPFGGNLEPRVRFGEGLIPAGITHYRWSYRKLGSLGDFTAMDHIVIRHYQEERADGTLVFKPFTLGPDASFAGVNGFKIRPASPPLNAGAVFSTWAPEVNARINSASAYFESHLLEGGNAELGHGLYELKLELFRANGSVVNWTTEGIAAKQPSVSAPFVGEVPTVSAPAERVFRNAANEIVGFRLVLFVDNAPCEAVIHDVEAAPGSEELVVPGTCGFMEYKPGASVKISFQARHPRNFATFTFNTTRGSGVWIAEASDYGRVGQNGVTGFTFSNIPAPSTYFKYVSIATLLTSNTPQGETACTRAAFAETLRVSAMATDGWSELTYLDRQAAPHAFAVEPVTPV